MLALSSAALLYNVHLSWHSSVAVIVFLATRLRGRRAVPLCNSSTPRCAWHAAAPLSICIMSEATEDSLLIPLTSLKPLPFPRCLDYLLLIMPSFMLGLPAFSSLLSIVSAQSLLNWAHFLVCKRGVPDRTSSMALLQSQHCVITGLPSSLPPCIDTECVSFLLAAQRIHLSSSGLNTVYYYVQGGEFLKTSIEICEQYLQSPRWVIWRCRWSI